MKNNFMRLALEEVGLATAEVPVEPVDSAEVDAVIDEAVETGGELVDNAELVQDVQEGLEALVASMESALVDPNYSPREYQLQVNHAQALLARIGCGIGSAMSCESTDGAAASKESFADKAKKLGQVIASYIKRFIEWLKDTALRGLSAMRQKTTAIAKLLKISKFQEVDFEYELADLYKNFKFEAHKPLEYFFAGAEIIEKVTNESGKELNDIIRSVMATNQGNREEEIINAFKKASVDQFERLADRIPGAPSFVVDEKNHAKFKYEPEAGVFKCRTKVLQSINIKEIEASIGRAEAVCNYMATKVLKAAGEIIWKGDTSGRQGEMEQIIRTMATAVNGVTHYGYRLMVINLDFIKKYLEASTEAKPLEGELLKA